MELLGATWCRPGGVPDQPTGPPQKQCRCASPGVSAAISRCVNKPPPGSLEAIRRSQITDAPTAGLAQKHGALTLRMRGHTSRRQVGP